MMTRFGLETHLSAFSAPDTSNRAVLYIEGHGMSIFASIDHARGASQANLILRPTEVLVYGSASGGTPLMQLDQSFGIDLPLKLLVWQDVNGKTWVSYTRLSWLADQHPPTAGIAGIAARLDNIQSQLALYATGESNHCIADEHTVRSVRPLGS